MPPFIAGGDQSNYVDFWKNTPVEDAINFVAAKPAPVGGTSAGMAIMSEFLYSAMSNSSLTSAEGLADPFHRDLTLDRDFLSLAKLGGLITDQHLIGARSHRTRCARPARRPRTATSPSTASAPAARSTSTAGREPAGSRTRSARRPEC